MRDYSRMRGALDEARRPYNATLWNRRKYGQRAGYNILLDWILEASDGEARLVLGDDPRPRRLR